MDSTELGCIVAGTLAIGLLSTQAKSSYASSRRSRHRGPRRGGSVCSSARSRLASVGTQPEKNIQTPGVSAKAAQAFAMNPNAPPQPMTDELSSFYETSSDSKAAIDKQLARESQYIMSKQKKPPKIVPIQEKTTSNTRDIGGYKSRLGSAAWEHESEYKPKTQAHSNCVGLPMGRYMESQYELQNGSLEMWNKPEPVDTSFLDFQKIL